MKKTSKILILLVIAILVSFSFNNFVNAANDRTTGSLTIIKTETGKTDSTGKPLPLKGVKFTIYKVDDNYEEKEIPTDINFVENTNLWNATTDEQGKAKFDNLPLGRYLVKETEYPANVVTPMQPFLVDIPMTNATGNGFDYDVVAEPKNETTYGEVVLNKIDQDNNSLVGVKFLLQQEVNGKWVDVPNTNGTDKYFTTNAEGKITWTGLYGHYRVIENSLGENYQNEVYNYIVDNKTAYEFNVEVNDAGEIDNQIITVVNDKPTITKTISSVENGSFNNTKTDSTNSASKGDVINYSIDVTVPNTISNLKVYKITDKMSEGLSYNENSIGITATTKDDKPEPISKNDYTFSMDSVTKEMTIDFPDKSILKNYKLLTITYKATLNENAEAVNNNAVNLEYSAYVEKDYDNNENPTDTYNTSDDVDIKTGGFKIVKVDSKDTDKKLSGAKFKIASTEENAKNEIFIKDVNGNEIVLETSENGEASYFGLDFTTANEYYYLVEIQAPVYSENAEGEKTYYELPRSPFKITVGENTFENEQTIVNKKATFLPSTGGFGTVIYSVIGILFISVGVVIYKKRKNEE